MGGVCFLYFLLIVSATYESFWTLIINIIKIVKMLKTKFRTLTPQDPKCQILSHMCGHGDKGIINIIRYQPYGIASCEFYSFRYQFKAPLSLSRFCPGEDKPVYLDKPGNCSYQN